MTPEQAALPGMTIEKPVKAKRAAARRCGGCGRAESRSLRLHVYPTGAWCVPCMERRLELPKGGRGGG